MRNKSLLHKITLYCIFPALCILLIIYCLLNNKIEFSDYFNNEMEKQNVNIQNKFINTPNNIWRIAINELIVREQMVKPVILNIERKSNFWYIMGHDSGKMDSDRHLIISLDGHMVLDSYPSHQIPNSKFISRKCSLEDNKISNFSNEFNNWEKSLEKVYEHSRNTCFNIKNIQLFGDKYIIEIDGEHGVYTVSIDIITGKPVLQTGRIREERTRTGTFHKENP